jgi:hypothetical protein
MILNKVVANKNYSSDICQTHTRAQSLLFEEMAIWYPSPYYDIEAMMSEETKGFKSNHRSKFNSAERSRNMKSWVVLNSTPLCALQNNIII